MADQVSFTTPGPGGGQHAAGLQGSRHPLTGEWEPFKTFGYDYTTGAVEEINLKPRTETKFTRNRAAGEEHYDELHFKNDYALEYELGRIGRAFTLFGLTANWLPRIDSKGWSYARPDLDQFVDGRPVSSRGDAVSGMWPTIDKEAEQKDIQAFLYQRAHLWDDRLIVSGGVSLFSGTLTRTDDTNLPPQGLDTTRNSVTDLNLGAGLQASARDRPLCRLQSHGWRAPISHDRRRIHHGKLQGWRRGAVRSRREDLVAGRPRHDLRRVVRPSCVRHPGSYL